MILSNFEIAHMSHENDLIQPFRKKQLNSASYDICLGEFYIEENFLSNGVKLIIGNCGLELVPGQFILAMSDEYFKIPNDLCAQFSLRSTAARSGLEHSMAGFCDPGWEGCLTLELKNINQGRSIFLKEGMRIGQMMFMRMSTRPTISYKDVGHYFGDKIVQGPKSDIFLKQDA